MRRLFVSLFLIGLLAAATSAAVIAAGLGVQATKHISFGRQVFYQTVNQTRTVSNKTDSTAVLSGQSGPTGAFRVTNNPCETIAPHTTCDITVQFRSGNTPGRYTGTLTYEWSVSGEIDSTTTKFAATTLKP